MYGAFAGDIIGSIYEFHNIDTKDFPLFQLQCFPTDDTYMTVAVAKACLKWADDPEHDIDRFQEVLVREMHRIGNLYPHKGYGTRFKKWLVEESWEPYRSYGNGSAMRVSPCAWVARTEAEALELAEASAKVTHNHPEGIKGARATAEFIYLCRTGWDTNPYKRYLYKLFYQNTYLPGRRYPKAGFTLKQYRENPVFDETCQGTVPPAFRAFYESNSFEDAIRNAISIGGDSDTLAAIAGSMAEAYYGIPDWVKEEVDGYLQRDMQPYELEIINEFYERFVKNGRKERT